MPFGHIFRAGSRIRIQVDTRGDSREVVYAWFRVSEGAITHAWLVTQAFVSDDEAATKQSKDAAAKPKAEEGKESSEAPQEES